MMILDGWNFDYKQSCSDSDCHDEHIKIFIFAVWYDST